MRTRSVSRHPPRPRIEALEDRALLSVCTVDRLTDLGQGQGPAGDLRYCLTQAQNGDTIRFEVTGVIALTQALPDLTRSISVEGPGADVLTVRRNTGGNYRVFTVPAGATVSLSGLTIANGSVGLLAGGGASNEGTLTITECTIADNTARVGGGVSNAGTLTVRGSTLSGNAATGGGPPAGGGILNTGTLTVANSTVSGNRAFFFEGASGGGITNTASGTLIVTGSTITGNEARSVVGFGAGGGLRASGIVRLRNTILAGNTVSGSPDLFGTLTSSGYNLIGNTQGGSGFDPTDLLNIDPLLGLLQDNGGPTLTHALLPDSPALDAGDPGFGTSLGTPKWDQRGLGFARVVGLRLDIGAYEEQDRGAGGFPRLQGLVGSGPTDAAVGAGEALDEVFTVRRRDTAPPLLDVAPSPQDVERNRVQPAEIDDHLPPWHGPATDPLPALVSGLSMTLSGL